MANSTRKRVGRPTKITPEIQSEILDRLSKGESARSICKDEHMPDWVALCRFKRKEENQEFNNHFNASRKEGMMYRMDEIWEKVQDDSKDIQYDEVEKIGKDGEIYEVRKVAKSDNTGILRHRLIAEQLRWEASRIYKDLYGEKITQEHTGPDGGAIQFNQLVDRPPKETPEEWQKRVERQLAEKKLQLVQ